MQLTTIETPALILDRSVLDRNLARMKARVADLGVALRPHLKTTKSPQLTARAIEKSAGVTVSTLREAEYFLGHGYRDITYAVGIEPSKLPHVRSLQDHGATINLILDHPLTAGQVIETAARIGTQFRVLIEIDSGSHRGGLLPDDPRLLEVAAMLHGSNQIEFVGLLTHAGCSYLAGSIDEIEQVAEAERSAVVKAASILEVAGIPCPVRSVGSTPTVLFAKDLSGITEVRPGVYMLMDLYQVGLGVCKAEDIAVSVLATVIGRRDDLGYCLIDAGALALSMDVSAANAFGGGTCYGQTRDQSGQKIYGDLRLDKIHQEHGWLSAAPGCSLPEELVPGTRVRIFPNHSCMMAAPYDRYHVVDGGTDIVDLWEKATGW